MKNNEVRKRITDESLKYWEVSQAYGLHESNFSRLLRKELNKEQKEKVFAAIEKAKQMKKEGAL